MTKRNRAREQPAQAAPNPGPPLARWRVLATVFTTGAAVLVVEIAGARVVSPLYGSGLYSWSALISVTLAALSLGYWVGGRAADRRPDTAVFHGGILLAGLLVVAIPPLAGPILRVTEPLDPRLGVLLAAALLFFLPLAVLGGVTPFAIRLSRPPQGEVGAVSGLIFAVSTVGSLLAALATGFLLIPNLGVRAILALTGATIMLTAIAGFLLSGRRALGGVSVGLLVLALLAWRGAGAAESSGSLRIVARTPSFFGFLRVVETDTERMLTVNGIGQNYLSLLPDAEHYPYLVFMSSLPRLMRASDTPPTGLLIGLGAGELVGLLTSQGVEMTAVELDPRVEELARRHFGLSLPHERVRILDGRVFLERDRGQYDFVFIDAFLGEDVPGHLYSREALAAVRRRLAPGGALAINYTTLTGGEDARALMKTLQAVFAHVKAYTDGAPAEHLASMVLVASDEPIAFPGAARSELPAPRLFLANELRLETAGARILTDDYNPINTYRLGANRLWRQAMIRHIGEDWAYWADF